MRFDLDTIRFIVGNPGCIFPGGNSLRRLVGQGSQLSRPFITGVRGGIQDPGTGQSVLVVIHVCAINLGYKA
jgi:hypothetical protein